MLEKRLDVTSHNENLLSCPRNGADVYYFGMLLQESVANVCKDLSSSRPNQAGRTRLDPSRFICKNEIQTLINTYLNQTLGHFYKNGGRVMLSPVSDAEANDIQPFFQKMADNFNDYLETMAYLASKGEMNAGQLQLESSAYIVGLLGTMERLYKVEEIRDAFADLISVEKKLLQ